MKVKQLYSPEVDLIIKSIETRSTITSTSETLTKKIAGTFELVGKIEPKIDYDDRIWNFWLRSERGDISAYGDYDDFKYEETVESYEEFESLWKDEYPDEIKWHHVTLLLYRDRLFFSIDSKCNFHVDFKTNELVGIDIQHDEIKDFVLWLLVCLEKEVKMLVENPQAYNQYIVENLPLQKRVGKIKRFDFWEGVPDAIREDKKLGKEKLEKFENVVNNLDESRILEKVSVSDFLRFCEIGYDANEYFKDDKKERSPREKYQAMSDMRHGGLLKIDPDSPDAFLEWYKSGRWSGAHPWEICSGGNTTHISLYVRREEDGWKLYLDGFNRADEVVKIAIALFENDVPFVMNKKEELLRKVKGEDFLGIVPEYVLPRYCYSLFPEEDRINDYLNPWHDPEMVAVVKEKAIWYPVEEMHLVEQ